MSDIDRAARDLAFWRETMKFWIEAKKLAVRCRLPAQRITYIEGRVHSARTDAVTQFENGMLSAGEVVDIVAKREAEVMMNTFLTEAEPELVEAFEAQATR